MKKVKRRLKKSVKKFISLMLILILIFLVCYIIFNLLSDDTKKKITEKIPIITTTTKALPDISIEKEKI